MKVIIPAAGYATRLYPMTKTQPKALLDIKGKPILNYILDRLNEVPEVSSITVVSNNKFIYEFDHWLKDLKQKPKAPVKVINDGSTDETNRLGAIKDIRLALEEEKINEDFLVINGDNLFNFSLKNFVDSFRQRKEIALGLYDVKDKAIAAGKYGVVEIAADKRLTGFEEKPQKPKTSLVSTGIYAFPQKAIKQITDFIDSGEKGDAPGYFLMWLLNKQPVYAYIFNGQWYDIGSFEELGKARSEFET